MSTTAMRLRQVLLTALLVLALALGAGAVSGCSREATSEPPAPEPEPTVTPEPGQTETTMTVTLYFVGGERLAVAARDVPSTASVAHAALTELLAGPSDTDAEAGLATQIPEGTLINEVSIADGVATVDVSPEFESGGGSLSMQLRVAQVVYTLTAFPTVERVAFEIDGAPVESIGGEGLMVSPPLSRLDLADNTLPAILVESPAPWQKAASPLRIAGMSNTFEASFAYEIVDQAGLIVAEGSGMATSGSGTWGTFDVTVPFEVTREGIGSLIVFEHSAKDGSRINLVEIPVELVK